MPTSTYEAVREAAETLATSASRDAWQLADAVLIHLPERPNGRNGGGTPPVSEALTELAEQLTADGCRNARGDTWTVAALDHLRAAAMAWPPETRHTCCAFYTHAEARSAEDRTALADLVAYAEDGARSRRGLSEEMRERIDTRRVRNARYLVTVDDVRLHRGRLPTRRDPEAPATPAQLAEALTERPEALAEAMATLDLDHRRSAVGNLLNAQPVPTRPEELTTRAGFRETDQRPPSVTVREVEQAKLMRATIRAMRALVGSFAAAPPHPDSGAMFQMRYLRDLWSALELAASGGVTDEAIADLLARDR